MKETVSKVLRFFEIRIVHFQHLLIAYLFNNVLIKSFNFLSNSGNFESELFHHDQDEGLDEHDVRQVLHERREHCLDAGGVRRRVVDEAHRRPRWVRIKCTRTWVFWIDPHNDAYLVKKDLLKLFFCFWRLWLVGLNNWSISLFFSKT